MRIFQVDAFTHARFTGNPATVIVDADGLDETALQSIAREFSHAETAFVSGPGDAGHDVRLRFFNARKEAPFVGHATLAAHAVLLALGRRPFGTHRQLSGTGVIEVRAFDTHGGGIIEFRQTTPELDAPVTPAATLRVAEALRLPAALLHESLPARIARKGSTRLLLPVGDARALESLAPDFDSLISLGTELGADGFFVFCVRQGGGDIFTESRMFCPALGILEDPVSGNAHAMLAAYLWAVGRLGNDTLEFVGHQGRWVNRPGRVSVRLEVSAGRLTAVHIGGGAVIVSEGVLL